MRFLTDENVNPSTVELLRSLGHDVYDIKEERQFGMHDDDVFTLTKSTDRLLVTLNYHDFWDQARYPASECAGIIASRIHPHVADLVNARLKSLLISTKPEVLRGKLTLLYRRGWRIGSRGKISRLR